MFWRIVFVVLMFLPPGAACACAEAVAADFPVVYRVHGAPVVVVTIKGQKLDMEVDTGAGMSFITEGAYDRLNLTGIKWTNGYYSVGVAGTMQLDAVVLENIGFGAITLRDELLGISSSAESAGRKGRPVDGLIGNDIMQFFDIGLDLPDHRITFYAPQGCAATETPWDGQFAPMPITRHKETLASTVDYGIDNATLAATIDSGAEISLVAQAALVRAGVTAEAVPPPGHMGIEGIGYKKIAAQPEQFASITVGAESFGDMWVLVANSPMAKYTDALIGEDYLSTHRVFIANSSNTAFFGLTVAGN